MLVRFELIFMCGIWIWTFFSVELCGLLKQSDNTGPEKVAAWSWICFTLLLFYFVASKIFILELNYL